MPFSDKILQRITLGHWNRLVQKVMYTGKDVKRKCECEPRDVTKVVLVDIYIICTNWYGCQFCTLLLIKLIYKYILQVFDMEVPREF